MKPPCYRNQLLNQNHKKNHAINIINWKSNADVTALTLPQLHYQHPPVKLLELGAEMLGWILGAQPTATTQYPIVHLPSVPVTTPLRPWSPHLNQGPAQPTNQQTNQQTNPLLEVPTPFKGSSLPFLICSSSSFRSSLAQTLLQTLVELVSPQLLPKTNKQRIVRLLEFSISITL